MTRANTLPQAYAKALKADFESGMSYGKMAEKYGKPVSTLKYHAYKLRLQRKQSGRPAKEWTPDDDAKLKEMWADDTVPKTSISNLLAFTWDSVNDRAEFLGLPPRPVARTFVKPFTWKITPWPKDMPEFEDHPRTVKNRMGHRFVEGEA